MAELGEMIQQAKNIAQGGPFRSTAPLDQLGGREGSPAHRPIRPIAPGGDRAGHGLTLGYSARPARAPATHGHLASIQSAICLIWGSGTGSYPMASGGRTSRRTEGADEYASDQV